MKKYFTYMLPAVKAERMDQFLGSIDGKNVRMKVRKERLMYNGDEHPGRRTYLVLYGTTPGGRRVRYNDGRFTSATLQPGDGEEGISYVKRFVEGRKKRISDDLRAMHPDVKIAGNGYLA